MTECTCVFQNYNQNGQKTSLQKKQFVKRNTGYFDTEEYKVLFTTQEWFVVFLHNVWISKLQGQGKNLHKNYEHNNAFFIYLTDI